MYLKLERTNTMRNPFEVIALTVGKVVHRIHVPLAPRTMVRMRSDNAVHDRVTEVHVGVRHVYLGTEHHLPLLYLTVLHGLEQAQVLLHRTISVR